MRFNTFALPFALTMLLATGTALAQIAPNDNGPGSGQQRGIQEQNNSGEVGTVTLTPVGTNQTRVELELRGFAPGHRQPAHIHRGKTCDTLDPKPAFPLHDITSTTHVGRSVTTVNYPIDRLLSGNYVVNVHASDKALTHYVACGELY